MSRQRAIFLLAAAMVLTLAPFGVSAERVGYRFEGVLEPTFSQVATLFNVGDIQLPAPITGTFSYDTASPPVAGSVGTSYQQAIAAGFTLQVAGQTLRLSANNFKINVANDFHRTKPDETVDQVTIWFDNQDPLTPGPIYVNDQAWTGTLHHYMYVNLTYPEDTFAGESLPAILPQTFSTGLGSGLGSSSNSFQYFRVTSLSPVALVAGDYSLDGKLDNRDFDKWRGVFGETSEMARYADGNGDGIVDGADYVIFRHAMAVTGSGDTLALSALPEPASLGLVVAGCVGMLIRRPRTTGSFVVSCMR